MSMRTTIHTCDICKESKSENDLARFSITTRGITLSKNKFHTAIEIDICQECLKKKGFIIEKLTTEEENNLSDKKNETLLKDKICEFLDDLGVAFYD